VTNIEYLKEEEFGNTDNKQLEEGSKYSDDREHIPIEYVQKYSQKDMLLESILIGNNSFFILSRDGKISIETSFQVGNKILKPFESSSYINRPYSFTSNIEVQDYINKGRTETLDSLYHDVKLMWKKFIDADDFHLAICAADTIFTYFQDKIGLTHYLFFVGNNGSGKSNNLTMLNILAYRNMMSTDVTFANIYQFLHGSEEGIGTICEDEADDLDEDRAKMRIYKNGYTTGHPVFRTDTSYGRKQIKFYTFCFKAAAAERLPDSLKAKGFNQRTIEIHCVYGFPEFDISEVLNPAGDENYEQRLDKLMDMRKRLLIYRLLHHSDKISDIKVNLENREKQLFKPLLRIFQKTETIKELVPVISKFIVQKRLKNITTLNAFLYKIIKDLIRKGNSYELSSSSIWQTITDPEMLAGEPVVNKKLSYNSVEFGEISQKQVSQILIDVFGATKPKRHGSSNKLIFDPEKMKRLGLAAKAEDVDEHFQRVMSQLDEHARIDVKRHKE
jgi:hypothetical protein